ncbi:hypothetical protein BDB13_6140 [Rhodococcus sp. OK302]|nr:hypothetical protein BDB13_6140 [Rhodococcus sp. OK302]
MNFSSEIDFDSTLVVCSRGATIAILEIAEVRFEFNEVRP